MTIPLAISFKTQTYHPNTLPYYSTTLTTLPLLLPYYPYSPTTLTTLLPLLLYCPHYPTTLTTLLLYHPTTLLPRHPTTLLLTALLPYPHRSPKTTKKHNQIWHTSNTHLVPSIASSLFLFRFLLLAPPPRRSNQNYS